MSRYNGSDRTIELGLLLLLGFLWGIPYALTKISLATIPPLTLVAVRVSIAAIVLWIVTLVLGRNIPLRWSFLLRLFVQGLVACVIPYSLIAVGQQSLNSALAAVLNSSTPLFVCFISLLATHHEPITWSRVIGITVGLGGVVIIVGTTGLGGIGRESIGQLLIVLATFSSAISVVHGRHFKDVSPEVAAAGMLTSAALILVPLSLAVEAPFQAEPSLPSVLALLANAIVATALGFVVYFRLIRTIGSMATASVGYLKPAFGVLIGCAFMVETLTWTVSLGLCAILVGVTAINGNISLRRLVSFTQRAA